MRFDGKTALITGGASGIGRAIALGFAQRGGRAVLVDINNDAAQETVNVIRAGGSEAAAFQADLTKPEQIERAARDAKSAFGAVDILYNNAYRDPPRDWAAQSDADATQTRWDHTLQLGLTATMQLTRLILPFLRERRGAIVNTASVAGLAGDYGHWAYSAMKAGLINLTRTIALEEAAHGVRANCICPGATNTALLQAGLQDLPAQTIERFTKAIPLGRIASAEELANAALFLGSDLASYITGAILVVDGGVTAGGGVPTPMTLGLC